ncbi:MAG: excinuclease ABC subunit UvrC [candidate division WOR-3 bacterium]
MYRFQPKDSITEKILNAPERSGVYVFKNNGNPIYIGKAKNLRNRLKYYLSPTDERVQKMVSEADDLEFIITDGERNAVFLEASLIKKHQPKYNIKLKSETPFYYIHLTGEEIPRVVLTRRPLEDGENFGPYLNRSQVRFFLKFARKLFPLRNCSLKLPSSKKYNPCIEYHIGRCIAPCRFDVKGEYSEYVERFKRFLSGDIGDVARYIYERMINEANKLNFEAAAIWRDRLRSLNEFMSRNTGEKDVWAIYTLGNTSCVVLYTLEGGIINGSYKFLTTTSIEGERGTLEEFLIMYYANNPRKVDEIIVPFELELNEINGIPIKLPYEGVLETVRAAEMYARLEVEGYIQKSQRIHPSLESLKKLLKLPKLPRIIEGFDVSHTFGTHKVASLVVFKDGKPFKSGYRRFKIKTVKGIDDYKAIYEVVYRRYKRVLEEGKELPDLILIDGGIGQLNSALKALEELNLEIPTVALAKRFETVILPGNRIVQIPLSEPALKLLQSVRDEAHRFALSYHRTLRSKNANKSVLDLIPGIGEKRKKVLLAYFGSIKGIKEASVEEIASLPGFNKKVAKTLKEFLNG